MRFVQILPIFVAGSFLVACNQGDVPATAHVTTEKQSYIVMDDTLQQLKDDFSANEGKVRLVFISGPTCGICLRGMADLNDEFIAAAQGDDRLHTYVVLSPHSSVCAALDPGQ